MVMTNDTSKGAMFSTTHCFNTVLRKVEKIHLVTCVRG